MQRKIGREVVYGWSQKSLDLASGFSGKEHGAAPNDVQQRQNYGTGRYRARLISELHSKGTRHMMARSYSVPHYSLTPLLLFSAYFMTWILLILTARDVSNDHASLSDAFKQKHRPVPSFGTTASETADLRALRRQYWISHAPIPL